MLFVYFFFGLFAAVAQVIFAREFLVVFFGQELALCIILAGWFAWIALGSFVYSKIAVNIKNQLLWFSILSSVLPFLLLLEIIAIRNIRALFMVPGYMLFPLPVMILAVLLVLGPFCFLTGLLFPLGIASGSKYDKTPALTPYIFLALGGTAGGILFSFGLTPFFNNFTVVFFSAAALFCTLLVSVKWLKLKRYYLYIFTAGLVLALYFTAGSGTLQSYYTLQRWKTFASGMELLNSKDSKYQNMAIGVRDGQYSVFENGRIAASFPDDYADGQFIHPAMLQHKKPKSVLFFGLPTNAIIREMAYYRIEIADFVQPDPLISKMMTSLQNLNGIKKAALIDDEGRHYLETTEKKYDLIICNLPLPSIARLNRYYSKEFFEEAKAALSQEGVFVTKITSSDEDIPGYDTSVYVALKDVFPNWLVSAGEIKLFYASNGSNITMDAGELAERYKRKRINSEYCTKYVFKTIFEKDRMADFVKELEQRSEKIYNSDLNTGNYYLNLKEWANLTSAKLTWILKVIFAPLFVFPVLFIVFYLLYFRKLKLYTRVNISAVLAGFSGIFLFNLLILLFQNLKGCMYGYLGLFCGLFMLGIFGGIFTSMRMKNINPAKLALAQGAFVPVVAALIMLNYFVRDVTSPVLYYGVFVLFFLSGYVSGIIFPLLVKLGHLPGTKALRSSSNIYAYLNAGAVLGCVPGAVFMIPITGLAGSAVFVIFINLLAGILLVQQD